MGSSNARFDMKKFICKTKCNCNGQRMTYFKGKVIIICSHQPAYIVSSDGKKKELL